MVTKEEMEAVAFNMSMQLIQHLSILLQRADEYYNNGDYNNSFKILTSVKYNIIQKLSSDERDNLKDLEKDFAIHYRRASLRSQIKNCMWGEKELKERLERDLKTLKPKLSSIEALAGYRILLQDYLEKYKFLIKSAEDVKRMF